MALANAPSIISELNYSPPETDTGFDPEDPFTYIKRCIFPYLKNPNTITTNQTLITMKVDVKSTFNFKVNVETTILVVCHQDDMETSFGMVKTDYLAGEVRKVLFNIKDGTWLGDVNLVSDQETVIGDNHLARALVFKMQDIDIGRFIQNG